MLGGEDLTEVSTGKEVRTLTGHDYSVKSVAFSPDGRLLASGSHDETIKLWDISDLVSAGAASGLLQWAVSARASSEYSNPRWSAMQATGAPNTFQCGDIDTAWAPKSSGPDPEWLELSYAQPVYATGIRVHETYNAGFIYRVDLIDTAGNYHTVWTGTDQTSCPGWFELTFPTTTYAVIGVKLFTQVPGWEEVDAVALIGSPRKE